MRRPTASGRSPSRQVLIGRRERELQGRRLICTMQARTGKTAVATLADTAHADADSSHV